jgi:hypothetical protein
MKKIISLGVVVIVIGGFFVWLYGLAVDTAQPELEVLPEAEYVERLVSPEGVRNVRSDTGLLQIEDITSNPVVSYDGDVVVFVENDDFSLIYYERSDHFLITLLGEDNYPFTRVFAEETFLRKLNITQAQACSLSVDVVIPPYIDFDREGSYGLSFCPDAIPIP